MKITLPTSRPYDALFAVGNRRSGSGTQEIGAIIVKAGFRLLAGSGGQTHALATDTDPAASRLVLADQGAHGPNEEGVTREADIASFKPVSDIAVEGYVAGLAGASAEVRVDGTNWLTRFPDVIVPNIADRRDRNRHLFGYHPRTLQPRLGEAGSPAGLAPIPDPFAWANFTPLQPPATLPAITGYSDRVLNFHRRGDGFAANAAAIAGAVSPGRRVAIIKGGGEALSVLLSHATLTAEVRAWCGTGPDEPPYWSRIRLGAMRADTLILKPDQGKAEILWRSVWDWRAHPTENYRVITVAEGVI